MRIAVIGTGHVGLTTCVSLAAIGHDVVGTDSDREKISMLKSGRSPFHEPGLDDLLVETLASGHLRFVETTAQAVPEAELVFICVGTPPRASGEASLLAVEQSAQAIARHATRASIVVEKSTVPIGTADLVKRTLSRERPELEFEVASNPEFLREGSAVHDALHPDRIVVGASSPRAFEKMREVYAPFTAEGRPMIETDIQTAELAKHACNAFLATKISFINAVARICDLAGADVTAVAEVMGADQRIGRAFLNAGLGYGGYCFPKDLEAFRHLSARLGYEFALLHEVARINDGAVDSALEKIGEALWNLEGKRIALLGLAFKPDTDDVRFSPALSLARRLLQEGARVAAYDPWALRNAKAEIAELEVAADALDAAAGAHCVVICTEWQEFRDLDLARLKDVMAYPLLVDGRNVFDPEEMRALGFTYYPTGRQSVTDVGVL